MATENDKVDSGALATLVVVGVFATLAVALGVDALVRHESSRVSSMRAENAGHEVEALTKEQRAALDAQPMPIERAMSAVVLDLQRNPWSATPPMPEKDGGADAAAETADAGADAQAETDAAAAPEETGTPAPGTPGSASAAAPAPAPAPTAAAAPKAPATAAAPKAPASAATPPPAPAPPAAPAPAPTAAKPAAPTPASPPAPAPAPE
jgi:hypothetical protein